MITSATAKIPRMAGVNDGEQARLDEKLRRELGDVVLTALADPRTEDIVLNPDSQLWVKRQGEGFRAAGTMPPTQALSAIRTIASQRRTVVNAEHPIIETELPIDGSRFEGIDWPVVTQPIFAIRLRPERVFTLEEYESTGILTEREDPLNRRRWRRAFFDSVRGLSHGEAIRLAVLERKNMVLLSALMAAMLIFALVTWWGVVAGLLLWVSAVAVLSRLGKADPMLRQVYIRHVRYRAFYPAKSGVSVGSVGTPRAWR